MLNNILAVAWKELQLIVRDRGALAIFFLLPLLLSTIQGGANAVAESEEGATAILLNVQLVNEDSGDFGREVMRAIENIDELAIETPSTVGDAEEAVRQGDAAAAILIFLQRIAFMASSIIDLALPDASAVPRQTAWMEETSSGLSPAEAARSPRRSASSAAESTAPRWPRRWRSRSRPRETRMDTALSLMPSSRAVSCWESPSMWRSTTASR